jgi:hypothetical protein
VRAAADGSALFLRLKGEFVLVHTLPVHIYIYVNIYICACVTLTTGVLYVCVAAAVSAHVTGLQFHRFSAHV